MTLTDREKGVGASQDTAQASSVQPDDTVWLIEEVWSGFVHYVHRNFDPHPWMREVQSIRRAPTIGAVGIPASAPSAA